MSRTCDLCKKGSARANSVSHSKRRVPRRQHPNLQALTVGGATAKVCSTCRRTLAKDKK